MATVTLDGAPTHTYGTLPEVGTTAPPFELVGTDLRNTTLREFAGKRKILSIVPSLDTGVCALSTRRFEEKTAGLRNTVVLVISADLPFAQKRFCQSEGIENVKTLSLMRGRGFAKDYGVLITDGAFEGVAARAVLVLDENDTVLYSELVPDIGSEPDYDAAIRALPA
jgi:thioredoxin-dependent peroxiredoxin